MFNRLPESKPARQRRLGGAIVSTVVHLVFIALAVRATGLKAAPAPKPVVTPIYLSPTPKPSEPTVTQPRTSGTPSPSLPLPPRPVLPLVLDIPDGIPVPGTEAIDPSKWENFGPPVRSFGDGPPSETPNVSGDSPYRENMVEKAVFAIPGTSTPRYPSMLQSAGVEGDVRAQFVVDTLGRVERGSIRILDTTHDLFGSAVRDALNRARFTPAEAGGRKVRQLAEQVFTFRITK